MGDQPQRREARNFEPPPWERDRFEQLARRKAEERADEEIAAAIAGLGEAGAQPPEPLPVAETTGAQETGAGEAKAAGAAVEADEKQGGFTEARMLEMLAELSLEDPPATSGISRFGFLGGVLFAAVGLMLVVFGIVILVRGSGSERSTALNGAVILGMGLGLVSLASLAVVRSLRQRGVI